MENNEFKNKHLIPSKEEFENAVLNKPPTYPTCSQCSHFKFDGELGSHGLGMCKNKTVLEKLIFSHCDSFFIDSRFSCYWFEEVEKRK
jgi:hypothetical protein